MDLTPEQIEFLKAEYPVVIDQKNGRFAAIHRFLFTAAIIDGVNEWAEISYERRWCYNNEVEATIALGHWAAKEFKDEPEGWHRAVDGTGRRRPHGNKAEEYIDF